MSKEEEYQKTPLSVVSGSETVIYSIILLTLTCLLFFISCVQGEEEVEMCATELLYQGILPSLPQYMVSACWFSFTSCLKVT